VKLLSSSWSEMMTANVRIHQYLNGELETTDQVLIRELWKTWLEVACQNPCPVCGNKEMSHDNCPVDRVERLA